MATTISTQTTINATPAAVWAVLTDFADYGEWNPFIDRLQGRAEAGQKLVVHMQPEGGRAMTFKPTVLVAEPGHELRWLGKLGLGGLFDGEHAFVLSALPDGSTLLVHSETFRGLLVRFMGGALTRTEASFHALNAALKARVESGV